MATSKIDICNSALSKLGVEAIASFAETSKAAKLCNLQYDKVRKKLLRSHLWNFAIKRSTLALISGAPLFGYSAAFQLPSDCIIPLTTNQDIDFEEEGKTLLMNSASCILQYISDITDVSFFDVAFEEALAYLLAAEFAYPLKQSNTLRESMTASANMEIRNARFYDAKVGRTNDTKKLQEDVWLNSRYSGVDND